MIQHKDFSLGEFSSTISIYEGDAGLFDGLPRETLLIVDENIREHLGSFFPSHAGFLSSLPLIRSEGDLEALSAGSLKSVGGAFRAAVLIPGGESAKTFSSVELILKTAFALGFARDSAFAAIGGGTLCDVAAFASSLFMRGNGLYLYPSTLLAMVDAAFGGKTGINYFGYKNMVGTFYPAREVRVMPSLLATLSEREYLSGLAEVIKSAMLDDAELLRILEERRDAVLDRDSEVLSDIIWRSLMVKGRIVLDDLRESGVRAHLNLGHTFGHALEALAGFGGWSHGECVAWGMLRALKLGELMGVTGPDYLHRCEALLRDYGYRLDSSGCEAGALLDAMKKDKKKQGGAVRFVLQRDLGDTFQSEVEDRFLVQVLN